MKNTSRIMRYAGAPAPVEELAALRRENEALSEQVKELVKAEGKLYRYQEQLDAQLLEYQELYQFNRRLNALLELQDIFALAADFIINNLGYEKVLFFGYEEETGRYAVRALDGYYRSDEEAAVSSLVMDASDPLLIPLQEGESCLVCFEGHLSEKLENLGALMRVSEYLLYPLGSRNRPLALLVVGNSSAKAQFCRRISDSEMALLGIGNLAGLLSSTIENQILLANTKKALEQERLAEAKYRGIFENTMEGIIRTTPQGMLVSCNPAAAQILGYDSPEQAKAFVTDVSRLYVNPEWRKALFREILQGHKVRSYEVELYRKEGSKCWVRLSVSAILGADGELLYLDAMMEDISERKEVEAAIQLLNEELEQRVVDRTRALEDANRELKQLSEELESAYSDLKQTHSRMLQQEKMASIGQLAAGVAHEINNPMGFIISNLNTLGRYAGKLTSFIALQQEALDTVCRGSGAAEVALQIEERKRGLKIPYVMEDIDHLVAECLEGAERVKKIVQELKSFSRLDESELKQANLNEGVESTINIVWNEMKFKAELRREYGELPAILCNPGQLNQVFMNLLINAVQAIDSFGVITVRTSSSDGLVRVSVSDTGCGIPPEKLERIFEPFYTTKEVGKGTGLGLSIVYDIVKKHNGEIHVESEAGKGTTFTVAIPVVAP